MNPELNATLTPTWPFKGNYGPLTAPLVVAGDRLIGVASSTIFAVDIYTGRAARTGRASQPEWLYTLDSEESFFGGDPQVTAANGVVYLMDGDTLKALRLADGEPVAAWAEAKVKIPQVISIHVEKDRVFVVSTSASTGATIVSGFKAATGAEAFKPKTITTQSPGPVTCGGDAVFFVASGALNAVNLDFGDPRWKFTGAGDTLDASTAPLVAGNTVVVAGQLLHGLDLVTGAAKFTLAASGSGSVKWHTPAADVPTPVEAATLAANFRPKTKLLTAASALAASRAAVASATAGTAVATNSAGEVVCFSLSDGKVVWRKTVSSPGAPVIIDGVVYVTMDGGSRLARFNYATGLPVGASLDLSGLSTTQPAAITNGALYLADDDGNIDAHPFATQSAAYFDGEGSMIEVRPDGTQFDFGTDNFTVEAWFRSSTGGEIISSHPTSGDKSAHGFRINLTSEGQIRVAVLNGDAMSFRAGRTASSTAADGEWHHVALVRRDGSLMVVLDGISHTVHLPEGADGKALSIGGQSALTIGALVPSKGEPARSFFNGLIREVRIWDCALDMVTIETNLKIKLTGAEPRLRGLWRLDEVHSKAAPEKVRNAVSRHRASANFVRPASHPTDLIMDDSAFPYLLNGAARQWPYAGTWAARGEMHVIGSPAVSSDGIVAFSTNNVIYAVGSHDGKRVWSMDVIGSASDPVADGTSFLVLTEKESLVRVDAQTGAKLQLAAFFDMAHESDVALAPPAVSPLFIAAATGSQKTEVTIWDRVSEKGKSISLPGQPLQLAFAKCGLVVLTSSGSELRLHVVDPVSLAVRGTRAVATGAFCGAGNWVLGVEDNAVVKLDGAHPGSSALSKSQPIEGVLTGLVASVDEDMLVAVTDRGVAYGMTLSGLVIRWKTTLPSGYAAGVNAINPPVLDHMGRVVCTTATGAIAMLDVGSGALLGIYRESHATLGTPAIVAGTVYTGCADSPANDIDPDLDGAMHSVVFGQSMALRLNLDQNGRMITGGTQHAVVTADTAETTLHLLQAHESCVEAWINVPPPVGNELPQAGGGIVGILPTTKSGFDINLWLESDGTVHYTSRALDKGVWSGIHVKAAANLNDGKWHHIAASRSPAVAPAPAGSPDRVIIYIDGVAVAAESCPPLGAPTEIHTGLKAYIGAVVADDLTASRPFRGMIAEVRVWDTYLVASEISSRMHVKLRGDEPDLIAYWNFDHETIHDSARQGHDGVLAEAITAPVWWLTDLPFTNPAYPYITSTASISSVKEGESTTYELVLKVCAADGSGLAKQDVHMWYVKHSADDPTSIRVNTTEVQAVESGDEHHPLLRASYLAKVFVATTASDGTLRLTVTTNLPGHGPSLDMWTSFMPLNERFHVNVLLDNQTLTKPAPPTLRAQSKLIQDYHYTTGNTIDHTRDRSTWRVVLRAADPNDRIRPREPVTIWASEPTSIEIRGVAYEVNRDNSVTVNTEHDGELTVVLGASALTAPTLYARAGFMHRNDRIVVSPDQDTHTQLSNLQAKDLTTPRVTNWKRDQTAGDKDTLVSNDYSTHASDIAAAVRQVTSSVTPADSSATRLRAMRMSPARQRRQSLKSTSALAAMRQPAIQPASDQVVVRRTLAGVTRPAAVNPDAFRASLGGNLGFVFETTREGAFKYTPLKTPAAVLAARGVPTPVPPVPLRLGGFFDDLWDGIKDVANDIYDGVTKVVVTIADTVQLAITTLKDGVMNVVHQIVDSVEAALDAVAGFFKQLLVGLEKLIAFLRALFDWQAIIDTHIILRDVFTASVEISKAALKNTLPFTNALRSISGVPVQPIPAGQSSLNGVSASAGGKDSPVIAGSKSVQGKSLVQKSQTTPPRSAPNQGPDSPPIDGSTPSDPAQVIARAIPAITNSILDLSPGDLVDQLKNIAAEASQFSLVSAGDSIAGLMPKFVEPLGWAMDILKTPIDIPFISELYKWITKEDLSILNVICLGLAIPVNIGSAVINLVTGETDPFAKRAASMAADLRLAASGSLLLVGSPDAQDTQDGEDAEDVEDVAVKPPATPTDPEIVLMVAQVITVLADVIAEYQFMFTLSLTEAQEIAAQETTALINVFQGIAGMATLSLKTFLSQPAYADRVRAVAGGEAGQLLPPYMEVVYTIYSVQMAIRCAKACAGAWTLKNGGSKQSELSKLKDRVLFPFIVLAAPVAVGLIIYQIHELIRLRPKLAAFGNSDVTKQYELFASRDIITTAPLLFEWMYTPQGKDRLKKWFPNAVNDIYHGVTMTRQAMNQIGVVLHGVAVFGYGS